jgi:glycine betaine/proline transport system ATP-binding protein
MSVKRYDDSTQRAVTSIDVLDHGASNRSIEEKRSVDKEVVLEFRNVSKVYAGSGGKHAVNAVSGINLVVHRGEVLCLMGSSGSGKSTLLRHINRLIEPSDGEILIDGKGIEALPDSELRFLRSRRIGMVFQHFGLLPHRTVWENVALPLELRGEPESVRQAEAQRQLLAVGLADWGAHYPHELSGGMQQRVGLARALVSGADILLMDEPFSALDPTVRRDLQDHFLRIVRERGITALLVTHDPAEALRLGDRIAVLRDGKLIQTGTPDALLNNPADSGVADFFHGRASANAPAVEPPVIQRAKDHAQSTAKQSVVWTALLRSILLGPAVLGSKGRTGLFCLALAVELACISAFFAALIDSNLGLSVTAAALFVGARLLGAAVSKRGEATRRVDLLIPLALLIIGDGLTMWRALAAGQAETLAHFPANRSATLFVASYIDQAIAWLQVNFNTAFVGMIFLVRNVIEGIEGGLGWLPWPVLALVVIYLSWRASGFRLALTSTAALLYVGFFGFWERTISTIALVGSSVFIALVIGIPMGILLAKRPTAQRIVEPLLDVMQTLPTFVYLIPAVAFFSVGKTPAVIATVIFALAPMIRLTALGLREVPKASVEAALAHGATPWQTLTKVELPLASRSLLLGINQTIVMSLSMVVVAALIGADGLGYDVMSALRNIKGGEGVLAGIAIVFCALIPDRIIQSSLKKRHRLTHHH